MTETITISNTVRLIKGLGEWEVQLLDPKGMWKAVNFVTSKAKALKLAKGYADPNRYTVVTSQGRQAVVAYQNQWSGNHYHPVCADLINSYTHGFAQTAETRAGHTFACSQCNTPIVFQARSAS
jgi:hypothetical protein